MDGWTDGRTDRQNHVILTMYGIWLIIRVNELLPHAITDKDYDLTVLILFPRAHILVFSACCLSTSRLVTASKMDFPFSLGSLNVTILSHSNSRLTPKLGTNSPQPSAFLTAVSSVVLPLYITSARAAQRIPLQRALSLRITGSMDFVNRSEF
jgi:hypothetical protein